MANISRHQKQQLAIYRDRLGRVERGEVWGADHPGPYTAKEKMVEIKRINAAIADLERQLKE